MTKKILLTAVMALALTLGACGEDSPTKSSGESSSSEMGSSSSAATECVAEAGEFMIVSPADGSDLSIGEVVSLVWKADMDDGYTSFNVLVSTDGRSYELASTDGSIQAPAAGPQCFEFELTVPEMIGDAEVMDSMKIKVSDYDDGSLSQTITVNIK